MIDVDELRRALPPDYAVVGQLGGGGQGTVFRGECKGIPAALKVFDSQANSKRIERELAALSSLDCPYLVKVLDSTRVFMGGTPRDVIAYELLSGGDLTALSGAPSRPSPVEIGRICHHVSTAAEALWARRIVHRDIKPGNIVAAGPGRYVLVDVGFAKHLDLSTATQAGMAVGTPGYMSPEQAAGRSTLTIQSDTFSLGVTLHEISSGVHPFGRIQQLIGATLTPPDLRAYRPDLPPNFCLLVNRMMSVRPHLRPLHVADLVSQMVF